MKIYRIAQGDVVLYHITTDVEADKILQNGFEAGKRHYFAKPENVKGWLATLWLERRGKNRRWENMNYGKGLTILKITVPQAVYKEEMWDWDTDEYSNGVNPGQVTYGEGKLGWNVPDFERQSLKNGVNCLIEVVDSYNNEDI